MTDDTGIQTWMVFEVLAGQRDTAEESLADHIEKLDDLETVTVESTDFDDIKEVDDPHPSLETGYSQVCEVECTVDEFSSLIEIVMNYGPTMIDVLGPDEITLDLPQAQESLNLVAEMMQKFLQAGAGGMMISRPEEEQ